MSVTFSVPSPRPRVRPAIVPCPECGATWLGAYGDPSCSYVDPTGQECAGYGLDPEWSAAPRGLNVANGAASLILFGLLGYAEGEVESWGGDLDPSDVLRRLATAEGRVSGLVSEPHDNHGVELSLDGVRPVCRVIEAGFSAERIARYIDSLRALAVQAIEAGAEIAYG